MATSADNSIKAAQILAVLQALGLYNYPTANMGKADVKDLLESYGKNINPKFEEIYDPVSGKYPPGSPMGAALRMIDEKGSSPETVKGMLYESGIVLNADQEKDLNDYSDYVAKRNMLQAERLFNMGQTSEGMGLPSPIEGFTVPTDVVAGLFRLQDGKSISGEAQKQADFAQRAYERYLAMKEMGQAPGSFAEMMKQEALSGSAETPVGAGGIVVNGKRYASMEEYEADVKRKNAVDKVQEETKKKTETSATSREDYESSIFAPTAQSVAMTVDPNALPTSSQKSGLAPMPPSRAQEITGMIPGNKKDSSKGGFDYRASIVASRQKEAELQALKDSVVAGALSGQVRAAYGSPYEMQVLAAQDRLAQIAAYEAWVREQNKLKKRRGY